MKKHTKAALVGAVFLLVVFISTWLPNWIGGGGNPYSLYGEGNCVYFASDMMERFWPTTFQVQRAWNAWQWVQLIGQRSGNYECIETDRPQPGDFVIWPYTKDDQYGHVAFIISVAWTFKPGFQDNYHKSVYTVIESGMYATDFGFPDVLDGCRYRQRACTEEDFNGAIFITWKEVD